MVLSPLELDTRAPSGPPIVILSLLPVTTLTGGMCLPSACDATARERVFAASISNQGREERRKLDGYRVVLSIPHICSVLFRGVYTEIERGPSIGI